jgi:hypothetical protein
MEVFPVPPDSFCQQLREYDPDLELNWDHVHGVWSIWVRLSANERHHVMNVINDDGSYRPLDGRTMAILRANRFFAQHPEKLEKKLLTQEEERLAQQQKVHEELGHFAKDKALNRRFKELQDKARSIPWEDWLKPHKVHGDNGQQLKTDEGLPVYLTPHKSMFEDGGKKPQL